MKARLCYAVLLDGRIDKQMLNTYESGRRPTGRRNSDWGLFTFKNSGVINAAFGLMPGQKEANKLRFSQLFLHKCLSVSTHDLVSRDSRFLLITDPHGKDWISVAEAAPRTYSICIRTVEIAPANKSSAEVRDSNRQWEEVSGLKSGGASFARPDNFVAWRSKASSMKGGSELADAVKYLYLKFRGVPCKILLE